MLRFTKAFKIYACVLSVLGLGSYLGYQSFQHSQPSYASHRIKRTHAEIVMPRQNNVHHDRNYRIYSHHFLAIEHKDLEYLYTLGNRLASHTNYVYENTYNGSEPIYKKYHDHNYWSVFHDQQAPKNFRRSGMNNATYNLIQSRVLHSHGIYNGVNFSHSTHKPSTEI